MNGVPTKAEERNKFLYETQSLLPYKRKEMVLDFVDKAKALMEQELILDAIYNQMDYKTMGTYDKAKYQGSIQKLEEVLKLMA